MQHVNVFGEKANSSPRAHTPRPQALELALFQQEQRIAASLFLQGHLRAVYRVVNLFLTRRSLVV